MQHYRSKAESKAQVELEQEFWKRVRLFRWIFQLCPYLSWVGVCNSLPMHTLKPGSDIDLLIVAKKGKLFTCRLWITVLLSLFGVRRHGKKTHKRFCLSFFIEEGYEDLSSIAIEEDIYLALWVKTLHPIAGDWNGYRKFLKLNQEWTRPLVGELSSMPMEYRERGPFQTIFRSCLCLLSFPFEPILKLWQLHRAQAKSTQLNDHSGTIINEHMLKFHDHDKRKEYRQKWKSSTTS